MSDLTARMAVDAVLARDGLRLDAEEYERLIHIFGELQPDLAQLHAPEFHDLEPAVTYSAS
jgi:hypothetical protein